MPRQQSKKSKQRGSVLVEYALLAPIVLLTLLIFLETLRFQICTILLDRAIYEMAYEARTTRSNDVAGIAQRALKKWNYFLFDPSIVLVYTIVGPDLYSAFYYPRFNETGTPREVVVWRVMAPIGLLGSLAGVLGRGSENEQRYSIVLMHPSINDVDPAIRER